MNIKPLVIISFLFTLCVTSLARTDDSNYLTVRQLPDSQNYEAVLSLNSSVCIQVNQDTSVTVDGTHVTIEAPLLEQVPCIFIQPIVYYEETAYIGYLAPGTYTVSWSQPDAFSWSTQFRAGDYNPIPTNSVWSLILLGLGIMIIFYFTMRARDPVGTN